MTKSKIPPKAGKLLILVILLLMSVPAFAQSVDTAWVRRYNGTGNGYDGAYAIAVDGSGNVYVTGHSSGDYATIKYYPNGDTTWLRRYNGPGNSYDGASAIAVDGSGNAYVTGYSWGSATSEDYATIKYYPDGDTAWLRRYNGPGNDYDYAYALAVDGSGNVYVTGTSDTDSEIYDYATIKYNLEGETLWVRRYPGPELDDYAPALAIDDSGNVYVAGSIYSTESNYDYLTIKYKADGDTSWVKRYNGPGNNEDVAFATAVDAFGNVYVPGGSYSNETEYDCATIKYNPFGDTVWVRRYDGPENRLDGGVALVVDDSGNVYVTGASYSAETDCDYLTIKYNSDGDTLWVRTYNGPVNGWDWSWAIALDKSGNVYISGLSLRIDAYPHIYDLATLKYNPEGELLWIRRDKGPSWDDLHPALAIDDSGNVYVAGTSYDSVTNDDYVTIKYIQFLRGDANGDGVINVSDVVYLINYLFINGPAPDPIQAGDVNCDGFVNVTDVVYLINYLFISGPPPCE